jgi:hypothetical protein
MHVEAPTYLINAAGAQLFKMTWLEQDRFAVDDVDIVIVNWLQASDPARDTLNSLQTRPFCKTHAQSTTHYVVYEDRRQPRRHMWSFPGRLLRRTRRLTQDHPFIDRNISVYPNARATWMSVAADSSAVF